MDHPLRPIWQSVDLFEFDAEDALAIIEAIGYSCFTVEYLPGAIHYPDKDPTAVLHSLKEPFANSSNRVPRPNGFFDLLPRVFVRRMLPWCDVQTLFSLRQTSFRLRKIISRSLIYKSIIRCALPLYHAILGTRHARRVLLIDFWEKRTTMWYDHCENFAMLINIPDWSRICQSCVERGSRINNRLTGTFRVCQYVKLDTLAQWLAEGETLPPWVWRESVGLKGQRQDLVEYDSVRHLDTGKRRSWKRLAPFNYMVASAVPYMDPQTDENESGVACKGCIPQSQRRREDGIRKVYSREEFLEHFQWCNRAQLLWQAYCQPDSRIPIDTTSYTEIQRAIDSVQTNG